MSRSLIPLLGNLGVTAINQAPNGAMYPANVPPAFVWKDVGPPGADSGGDVDGVRDPSGKQVLTLWWEDECHFTCFQSYPGMMSGRVKDFLFVCLLRTLMVLPVCFCV